MKSVQEIYEGSDGTATLELYQRLETLGAPGLIALNLFRACKASERAKKYRRKFKGVAYEKKTWSLKLLCVALYAHVAPMNWGWKEDPTQEFHKWVLYIDLPTGQASFHSANSIGPNRYHGEWDGQHLSARRIIAYVHHILTGEPPVLHLDIGTGNISNKQRDQISEHLKQTDLYFK